MSVAIIGGTGVYALGDEARPEHVATPYGDAAIFRLSIAGQEVVFLPRHGTAHATPPHRVNYRANIWALHALGVRDVLATQAVGSMHQLMAPGHFVALTQFIDWTKGRPSTFFDGEDGVVLHVDVTHPYCPRLNARLLRAGEFLGPALHGAGVYACTEGPRFETAAEVRALRQLGADVVGMTSVPEAVLAREAGLCYAAVCIVCNWGAGMTDFPLTHEEVLGIMAEQTANLRELIHQFILAQSSVGCSCESLGFARYLPQGTGALQDV
ncbi:MAG TPA: S-methyl-5'-thioadenosine phosphorylase [Armatimonadota bacterium]